MKCRIERFQEPGGILRGWDDGDYGDPYQLSAAVRWVTPTTIELMGLMRPIDLETARAIKEACREHGVEQVIAARIKSGRRIENRLRVGEPRTGK